MVMQRRRDFDNDPMGELPGRCENQNGTIECSKTRNMTSRVEEHPSSACNIVSQVEEHPSSARNMTSRVDEHPSSARNIVSQADEPQKLPSPQTKNRTHLQRPASTNP